MSHNIFSHDLQENDGNADDGIKLHQIIRLLFVKLLLAFCKYKTNEGGELSHLPNILRVQMICHVLEIC